MNRILFLANRMLSGSNSLTFRQNRDERLAGRSKAQAHELLDQERELFAQSFKHFDRELEVNRLVRRDRGKIRALKGRAVELSDETHATVSLKQESPAAPATAGKAKPRPAKAAQSKRPLWGSRKWPSYYANALDEKKVFAADSPRAAAAKADAEIESGDDDRSIDQSGTPERCTFEKPCSTKAHAAKAHVTKAQALWRRQQVTREPHEYPAGQEQLGSQAEMLKNLPTHPSLQVCAHDQTLSSQFLEGTATTQHF